LHDARSYLDKMIDWKAGTGLTHDTPLNQGYKQIRATIESELEASADRVAAAAGDATGSAYRAAKEKYAAAAWIEKAANNGATRDMSNRKISLGDHLFGIAGSIMGGNFAPILGLATAAASAAVSGQIRARGDQVAASVASALARSDQQGAKLLAIQRVADKVDNRLANGIRGYLSEAPTRSAVPTVVRAKERDSDAKIYATKRNQLAAIQADPARLANAVAARTVDVSQYAPGVAASYTSAASRGAAFLASVIPKPPPSSSLTPQHEKWKPNPVEAARFARFAQAVDDPLSVVDDLNKGKINREGIEAIRTVYPVMFATIQNRVADELAKLEKPLPYSKQVELSVLLGVAAHKTLQPKTIARYQQIYSEKPTKHGAPSRPITISSTLKTRSQQIEGMRS
jgi:hypothetical protein